jgi:hypothetical protein
VVNWTRVFWFSHNLQVDAAQTAAGKRKTVRKENELTASAEGIAWKNNDGVNWLIRRSDAILALKQVIWITEPLNLDGEFEFMSISLGWNDGHFWNVVQNWTVFLNPLSSMWPGSEPLFSPADLLRKSRYFDNRMKSVGLFSRTEERKRSQGGWSLNSQNSSVAHQRRKLRNHSLSPEKEDYRSKWKWFKTVLLWEGSHFPVTYFSFPSNYPETGKQLDQTSVIQLLLNRKREWLKSGIGEGKNGVAREIRKHAWEKENWSDKTKSVESKNRASENQVPMKAEELPGSFERSHHFQNLEVSQNL